MRIFFVHAVIVAALLTSGCAGLKLSGLFRPDPADWTMSGGRTNRQNSANETMSPPFTHLWTYNAQGGIVAAPLVRDSVVIVATLHGELQAISLTSGRRIGYEIFSGPINATPVLDGIDVLLCISQKKASVVRYNLRDGRSSWTSELGPIEASPLLVGDRLVVATLSGSLVCLNKQSGEELWRYSPGSSDRRSPMRSSPVLSGSVIACGADNGLVHAVDAEKGTAVWQHKMRGSVFAGPIAADGKIIVGDITGLVHAISVSNGSVVWSHDARSPVYGAPATDGSRVFVPLADGRVCGLDAQSGRLDWTYSGKGVVNSSPLVVGDKLVFGALDRSLTVLSTSTGKSLWQTFPEGRIKVSPVVWKGTLIVVSEDKSVMGFRGVIQP